MGCNYLSMPWIAVSGTQAVINDYCSSVWWSFTSNEEWVPIGLALYNDLGLHCTVGQWCRMHSHGILYNDSGLHSTVGQWYRMDSHGILCNDPSLHSTVDQWNRMGSHGILYNDPSLHFTVGQWFGMDSQGIFYKLWPWPSLLSPRQTTQLTIWCGLCLGHHNKIIKRSFMHCRLSMWRNHQSDTFIVLRVSNAKHGCFFWVLIQSLDKRIHFTVKWDTLHLLWHCCNTARIVP